MGEHNEEKCIIIKLNDYGTVLNTLLLALDERQQRLMVGSIALSASGDTRKATIARLHEITKFSIRRIKAGMKEVRQAVEAFENGDQKAIDYFITTWMKMMRRNRLMKMCQ